MKIKFFYLLLILAGIMIISGCIYTEPHPLDYNAPENLYKIIYYPYAGLIPHGGAISDVHPHVNNLKSAISILDRNIEKADIISMQLKAGIKHHKEEGMNVNKLEALLLEYNHLIEKAKKDRALADTAFNKQNSNSFMETNLENYPSKNIEREHLIRSQKIMIKANIILKEIFEEFHRLMPGNEELNKKFRLDAKGDGKAIFVGNLTLSLHLENGNMTILNPSKDVEIDVKGRYKFEEKKDVHDNVLVYNVRSADIKTPDSLMTVILSGSNITIYAYGNGHSSLFGNGTYRIENAGKIIKEKNWATPFLEKGMSPYIYGPSLKDYNVGISTK
jgi:hypothetical protein